MIALHHFQQMLIRFLIREGARNNDEILCESREDRIF